MGSSGSKKPPPPPPPAKEAVQREKPIPQKQENAAPQPLSPPPPAPPEQPPERPKCGTYTPFTEFPTLELLEKAQKDYTAANVQHKLGEDGIPLPFPPPTKKDEVFKPEDYRHIDDHARNAPLKLGGESFKDLANYLISPAKNDIGKVRAFFVWIANQGLQRLKAFEASHGMPDESSPLFVIAAIIYNRCAGNYPEILARLCSEVQIQCKIVTNDLVKDVSYDVGAQTIEKYNATCIVYVDQAWRIIDQHWGSQGVLERTNNDWEYIAGKKTNRSTDDYQIVYQCDDFYFLTDPEVHIYKQWAANNCDQLLARPVTQKEFIELANLTPAFHKLGLTSIDPPKCRIVAETGQATIRIRTSPDKKYKFNYTLYKSKYITDCNEIDGVNLDRFVLLERRGEFIQVTVNLRRFGKHKLELYGGWDKDSQTYSIGEYLIDCRKPNTTCMPYPDSQIRFWGLTFKATTFGLVQEDNDGGVVTAEKGQAIMRFRKTTHKAMTYTHHVWSDEVKREEMKQNVRHYVTDDDVIVLVDVPKSGQYVYELIGQESTGGQSLHLGNFIIEADRGVSEMYPYPHCDGADQQVGDLTITGEKFLVADSHPKPIFAWESEEELVIRMKIIREAVFTASLKFSSENQQETDYSHYLHKEMIDHGLNFRLKFPRIGFYKLTVFAGGKTIYQYIIKVKEVGPKTLPYPKWKSVKMLDGFELLEPTSLYLKAEERVRFRMRVVEAVSVTVVGTTVTELRKVENSDIWEEEVVIDNEERDINVFIQTDNSSTRKLFLTYQVKNKYNMMVLLEEQQFQCRRAKDQAQKNKRKEESETKEAERRAKALEKKKRGADDKFEQNKYLIEKEEKEFEMKEAEARKTKLEQEEENQFRAGKYDEKTTYEDLREMGNGEEEKAKKRLKGWQITYEEMRRNMARERLRHAAISRQPDKLKTAIDECIGNGFNDKEIESATVLLRCLTLKQELKTACKEGDTGRIDEIIETIMFEELYDSLDIEVKEARREMRTLNRLRGIKPLDMDRRTLTEVKSYNNPSPGLRTVLQAVLLLVNIDEEKSSEWKKCQSMMTTVGKNNMLQKIVGLEINRLHPEICARAQEILDTVDKKELKRGAAVATFYAWSMGVIEDAKELNGWDDTTIVPADIDRQKEIFRDPTRFQLNGIR